MSFILASPPTNLSSPASVESIQDAAGAAVADSASIDFTYNDAGDQIYADVIPGGVNHDLLLNYSANRHIDHSAVVLTAGVGLDGGGDITASRSFDLADTAVTPGSYTSANITVDQQGRITAAASGASSGANTSLSNLTSPTAINQSLLFGSDKAFDIGAQGATRPRYLFIEGIEIEGNTNQTSNTGRISLFDSSSSGPWIAAHTKAVDSQLSSFNFPAMRVMLYDGTGLTIQSSPTTAVGVGRTFTNRFTIRNSDGAAIIYGSSMLLWDTDNSGDIGSSGANRPRTMYVGTSIQNGDGSAASPSYSFNSSGNSDNGMYLSAANQLGFSTAGTARWNITSSGSLIPASDNTVDIGSTTLRPSNINSRNRIHNGISPAHALFGATHNGFMYAGNSNYTDGFVTVMGSDAASNITGGFDSVIGWAAKGASTHQVDGFFYNYLGTTISLARTTSDGGGATASFRFGVPSAGVCNFIWPTDGGGDIGAFNTTRPNKLYMKSRAVIGTNSNLEDIDGQINLAGSGNSTITIGSMNNSFSGGNNEAGIFFNDYTNGSSRVSYGWAIDTSNPSLKWMRYVGNTGAVTGTQLLRFSNTSGANADILWNVDGNGNIGADGATRPNNIFAKTTVKSSGTVEMNSNATLTSTADLVQLGAYDIAAGERTLAISTEKAVASDIAVASTHSLTVNINGTNYRILLAT